MKSHDEIKKGLECCGKGNSCRGHCPYDGRSSGIMECTSQISRDALSYIQQLESKLNQAVEDIRILGRMGINICPVCANYNHGQGCKECVKCLKEDNFKWRGVVNEG